MIKALVSSYTKIKNENLTQNAIFLANTLTLTIILQNNVL